MSTDNSEEETPGHGGATVETMPPKSKGNRHSRPVRNRKEPPESRVSADTDHDIDDGTRKSFLKPLQIKALLMARTAKCIGRKPVKRDVLKTLSTILLPHFDLKGKQKTYPVGRLESQGARRCLYDPKKTLSIEFLDAVVEGSGDGEDIILVQVEDSDEESTTLFYEGLTKSLEKFKLTSLLWWSPWTVIIYYHDIQKDPRLLVLDHAPDVHSEIWKLSIHSFGCTNDKPDIGTSRQLPDVNDIIDHIDTHMTKQNGETCGEKNKSRSKIDEVQYTSTPETLDPREWMLYIILSRLLFTESDKEVTSEKLASIRSHVCDSFVRAISDYTISNDIECDNYLSSCLNQWQCLPRGHIKHEDEETFTCEHLGRRCKPPATTSKKRGREEDPFMDTCRTPKMTRPADAAAELEAGLAAEAHIETKAEPEAEASLVAALREKNVALLQQVDAKEKVVAGLTASASINADASAAAKAEANRLAEASILAEKEASRLALQEAIQAEKEASRLALQKAEKAFEAKLEALWNDFKAKAEEAAAIVEPSLSAGASSLALQKADEATDKTAEHETEATEETEETEETIETIEEKAVKESWEAWAHRRSLEMEFETNHPCPQEAQPFPVSTIP